MTNRVACCAIIVVSAIIASAAAISSRIEEKYTLPKELCESVRADNVTDEVLRVCDEVDAYEDVCTVGCDYRTLCSNPSVAYCAVTDTIKNPSMCDITSRYIGRGTPSRLPLHRVFHLRRGACLTMETPSNRVADSDTLRDILASFPVRISVTKRSLVGSTDFLPTWAVRLLGDGTTDIVLPLKSSNFYQEIDDFKFTPSAAIIPVMYDEITSTSPTGKDTMQKSAPIVISNYFRDLGNLSHDISIIHVTISFNSYDTMGLVIGNAISYQYALGSANTSPVSTVTIREMSDVWLCIEIDVKASKVISANEIIREKDRSVTFSRVTREVVLDPSAAFIEFIGAEPAVNFGKGDGKKFLQTFA